MNLATLIMLLIFTLHATLIATQDIITLVRNNDIEQVQKALQSDQSLVTQTYTHYKDTLLHFARTPEMITLLIDFGANPNQPNSSKELPIHTILGGLSPCSKEARLLIIEKTDDINAKTNFQQTPLTEALTTIYVNLVTSGGRITDDVIDSFTIVKKLISKGADKASIISYAHDVEKFYPDIKNQVLDLFSFIEIETEHLAAACTALTVVFTSNN